MNKKNNNWQNSKNPHQHFFCSSKIMLLQNSQRTRPSHIKTVVLENWLMVPPPMYRKLYSTKTFLCEDRLYFWMGVKFRQPLHVWEWIKIVNKGHKHKGTKQRTSFHRLLFPSFIYQSWYSRETNEILLKSFWFYWMLECRLNKDIDLWHTVISPSVQIWLSPHCFTGNSNESLTIPQESNFFLF